MTVPRFQSQSTYENVWQYMWEHSQYHRRYYCLSSSRGDVQYNLGGSGTLFANLVRLLLLILHPAYSYTCLPRNKRECDRLDDCD